MAANRPLTYDENVIPHTAYTAETREKKNTFIIITRKGKDELAHS